MSKILIALAAIAAVAFSAADASAATKRCKPGYKYDKDTKMCVPKPPRGSYF